MIIHVRWSQYKSGGTDRNAVKSIFSVTISRFFLRQIASDENDGRFYERLHRNGQPREQQYRVEQYDRNASRNGRAYHVPETASAKKQRGEYVV